jgi:hypothetical protein
MARATGLEPATSGVTGRHNPSKSNILGYFPSALTGLRTPKVSAQVRPRSAQGLSCGSLAFEGLQPATPLHAKSKRPRPVVRSAMSFPITCQETNRPDVPCGLGPDSQFVVSFVACVSRSVSPTEQTQSRDGMTMRPDTANARYRASPITLHREGIGDENIRFH